MSPDII